MSNGFEIVEELDAVSPGRPLGNRAKELDDALASATEANAFGVKIALADDEKGDKFYRFSQRVRAAAKRADLKINVAVIPGDDDHANVRILGAM